MSGDRKRYLDNPGTFAFASTLSRWI